MLGLVTALRLSEAGFASEVFESSPHVGGLASTAGVGDYVWDRFYHVILLSDLHLRALLAELDLESKVHWKITKTGFYADGGLHSLSSAIDFLRFPFLSPIDKMRLGWTIFAASRIANGRRLEDIPVADWLSRNSGRRVFERIWLPLLKSKLGENHQLASAAFIWAIIRRLYAARRSGLKREMFGYVEGGYHNILDRLQRRLQGCGVDIHSGSKVVSVERDRAGVRVRVADDGEHLFDSVVFTVPTPLITQLCAQLSKQEADRFSQIAYQGIICASMLVRRPLADYYVTNIVDDWVPFTGVIEMTTLVDRQEFGGNSLVYLPKYLTQDDPHWKKPDHEIKETFLRALMRMYPDFHARDVLDFRVARARHVSAISTLGYSNRLLPSVRTSVPGVYVLNSAQIANGTQNVNETLGIVESKMPELLSYLETEPWPEDAPNG